MAAPDELNFRMTKNFETYFQTNFYKLSRNIQISLCLGKATFIKVCLELRRIACLTK